MSVSPLATLVHRLRSAASADSALLEAACRALPEAELKHLDLSHVGGHADAAVCAPDGPSDLIPLVGMELRTYTDGM